VAEALGTIPPLVVETDSDNEAHPPPADINSDFACSRDALGFVVAGGTVTNHSSETSTYSIFVVFEQGGVRLNDARAYVADLQAGQTARWQATALSSTDGELACRVQEVERRAS